MDQPLPELTGDSPIASAGVRGRGDLVHWAALVAGSRAAPVALVGLLVGLLASWHLATYPTPWFDEGSNLETARNLARSGVYGLVYDRMRVFDPEISTGPTVVGPVALTFTAFGPGLAQGRAVMVVYALLAALGLYCLASRLYGAAVGGLAVLVLCAVERASPAVTRDVVGEMPAVAYLFWAAVLFVSARTRGGALRYLGAGLVFGLAVLTKAQFGVVLPALVGVWLLTRGGAGGFSGPQLALVLGGAIAPQVVWQLTQIVILGPLGFVQHLGGQSDSLAASALVLPLSRALTGARSLLTSHWGTLLLAGLAYVWWTTLRHGWRDAPAERLVLPAFASAWLAWYVGLSVGYERYTIPFFATGSLFVAVVFWDLMRRLELPDSLRRGPGWRAMLHDPLRGGLALVVAAPIVSGIASHLVVLQQPADLSAQRMAALIDRQVEPQATVETREWQVVFFSEHPAFQHRGPAGAAYLLDGPLSKRYELFNTALAEDGYRRIASVGVYDLYVRGP
jgi:4-amino-4-deoxy-L-arabinose transferase-like glycosyltransferase